MKVSAPIPHILSLLAIKFRSPEDSKECIDMLESIETSNIETNSNIIDTAFQAFMKELVDNQVLIYRTAAFAATYLAITGQERLSAMYNKLLNENYTTKKIPDFYAGYLSGIFTTALMNDLGINSIVYEKKGLPKTVEDAIKYIESEGFSVYVK